MIVLSTETHKVEVSNIRIDPAVMRIRTEVNGENSKRALVNAGGSSTLSVSCLTLDGQTVPINDTFAVPVRRVGGAVERTIGITFTNGVTSKTINWPNSGEFEITEDLINMNLPEDQHFKFDRLVFSVYE